MKKDLAIIHDRDRCVSCNECILVCPQSGENNPHPVIVPAKQKGEPPEIKCIENCIECMTCWDFCRARAITFANYHVVERLAEDETALKKVAKII
ncbi:MAG TPA: 4Fe-4S binding protein [Dissulfurispiraceae bacterium]|nr:4Fe-4S binding protein [Dissulfurispiraceae bacterium]